MCGCMVGGWGAKHSSFLVDAFTTPSPSPAQCTVVGHEVVDVAKEVGRPGQAALAHPCFLPCADSPSVLEFHRKQLWKMRTMTA